MVNSSLPYLLDGYSLHRGLTSSLKKNAAFQTLFLDLQFFSRILHPSLCTEQMVDHVMLFSDLHYTHRGHWHHPFFLSLIFFQMRGLLPSKLKLKASHLPSGLPGSLLIVAIVDHSYMKTCIVHHDVTLLQA